jgi:hypothetical protein
MTRQEPFVIRLGQPIDAGRLSREIRIDESGRVEMTVESNEDDATRPSIGVYGTNIGPDHAARLRQMLLSLEHLKTAPSEELPPGESMALVSLTEQGTTRSRHIDPYSSVPAICRAADEFRHLEEEALKQPHRVVGLRSAIQLEPEAPRASLRITLRVTSIGTEPVAISDPRVADGTQNLAGFTLSAVRSDLPPQDIWPQHSKHIRLSAQHLVASEVPGAQGAPGVLSLKPNEQASFTYAATLDGWEPGTYSAKMILETGSPQGLVLVGRIVSMPVAVDVRGQ